MISPNGLQKVISNLLQAELIIKKERPLQSVNNMELIEIKLDWLLNSSCISKCISGTS